MGLETPMDKKFSTIKGSELGRKPLRRNVNSVDEDAA